MKRARILLADDHRIVAEGLRGLLEPEFELLDIVKDGRAMLESIEKLTPDIVVVDISMPLLNGIEAVRQIKKKNPKIAVVFLTMYQDVTYAARAFEVGALGYVLKHSAPSELITAIKSALQGKTYITPLLKDKLLKLQEMKQRSDIGALGRLTQRQREVLQLLAEGYSAKEVGAILHISTRTVEFHKYAIMDNLGLKTTADLVRYAMDHGIK